MGIGLLIYSVLGVIEGLTKLKVSQFSGMVGVGYFTWAIGQFFDEKKYINYLIAFFSYLLGMITFVIAVVSLVLLIDLMI